ncbi:MAG: hypothetical protein OKBPIBMD_01641 [Chlorobi bacterium]|nr:MAG: hypothetical protein F9K28_03580 [Bacteroidota bacterium]KXK34652.1 MAG: hypothetical protein UZ06_CHB003001115 [Chlorobi bacterium OLB6]MBV6464189.1 hypothetical protein [Chlorobiota bacterium]MCC6330857.1 hypothetical protein [Ignavibacteria bacterium]MCL4276592.1 hypothetical protein [Ignavibacteria bacterium]
MNRNQAGIIRQLKDNSVHDHQATFRDLCRLMDDTEFNRPPYRGILGKVAEELGLRGGRRSVYKSIRISRTIEVMVKVAEHIREAEAEREKSLDVYARMSKGR